MRTFSILSYTNFDISHPNLVYDNYCQKQILDEKYQSVCRGQYMYIPIKIHIILNIEEYSFTRISSGIRLVSFERKFI